MSEQDDFNARVMREFRENKGKVGGFFADKDLLILHTTGAKSGEPRVLPLVCIEVGDNLCIIASAGGSPTHPAWFHNLVANPGVKVEYGTEKFEAQAMIASEPTRSELYEKAAARYSFFGEYAEKTSGIREIPVIVLERLEPPAES